MNGDFRATTPNKNKPHLLVPASTFSRNERDHEPNFIQELGHRMTDTFEVAVLCPHSANASCKERLDGVMVHCYRYARKRCNTLVNNGGIIKSLKKNRLEWLLVPLLFLTQLWAIWQVIKRWRPDIVHAHWFTPQGLIVALLSLILRNMPPFLITSHNANLLALRALVRVMPPIRENIPRTCPDSISQRMALCLCRKAFYS